MVIKTDDIEVAYEDTPELRDQVFTKVLGFLINHQVFSGESVMQDDEAQLDAAEFLGDLADGFEFEVDYIDE